MESTAAYRSLHCAVGTALHVQSLLERSSMVFVPNGSWPTSSKVHTQGLTVGRRLISSPLKQNITLLSCTKTSEAPVMAKTDALLPKNVHDNEAASSNGTTEGSLEKNTLRRATFPSGFEELVLEVCDETEVAELKLKVGEFEMHVKRNIGAAKAFSPMTTPPVPTESVDVSAPVDTTPSRPKSAPEENSRFINVSSVVSSKLAALEAFGATGYVIVTAPGVGSFRRSTGAKKSPACNEGDIVEEGKAIGYLDQFGTLTSIVSNEAGEVLMFLVEEGEGVGYGDPIAAVLPSFHGVNNIM